MDIYFIVVNIKTGNALGIFENIGSAINAAMELMNNFEIETKIKAL